MKTSIIIHGHFYQPPRENPATDLIPKQIETGRFSDWNEAITESCYKANCHSRFLGPYGGIKTITNNYSSISWNFGPTLLRWFSTYEPGIIEKLKEADQLSIKATGHGNGIAQGFGHSILPLDTPENREIQIAWGIEDFKYRFNRMPEGFWCPECAINPDVIDSLSKAGIKFVILSPWQAESIQTDSGSMKILGRDCAPCDEPFWIQGRTGKLAAFFYNPELASAVSFGHLLRDADAFYDKLLSIRRASGDTLKLLHYATDGEIYGHHEPFGDMALAALIEKINAGSDFEITNYGAYLEKHPPVKEAILRPGDDNLGTSWSCIHGVGRWFRDCGCSTGGQPGWNQKWRTPLREAFSHLNSSIWHSYSDSICKLFGSEDQGFGQKLLTEYAQVVTGEKTADQFLISHKLEPSEHTLAAKMLCGMKNLLYSFTSCGWFFNDISGIEPRQNINYAMYAIKLFWNQISPDVLTRFLSDLSKAQSNIPACKTGREMALDVARSIEGCSETAIAAFLNHLVDSHLTLRRYGCYKIEASGDFSEYLLSNTFTLEKTAFHVELEPETRSLLLTNLGPDPVFCILASPPSADRKADDQKRYLFASLPGRLKDQLLGRIDDSVSIHGKNLVMEIGHSIEMLGLIGNYENPADYSLSLRSVKQLLHTDLETIMSEWPQVKLSLIAIITQISKFAPQSSRSLLRMIISSCIQNIASDIIRNGYSEKKLEFCYDFLRTVRQAGTDPDITAMQEAIYPYLQDSRYSFPLMEKVAVDLNFDIGR